MKLSLMFFLTCCLFSKYAEAQTTILKSDSSLNGLKQEKKLDSLLRIGMHYYGIGESVKAIECYNKIISKYPNYSRAYFNRGNAWSVMGNHEQGCKDWEKAKSLGHVKAEEYLEKFGCK